jgi:hypothetical protein
LKNKQIKLIKNVSKKDKSFFDGVFNVIFNKTKFNEENNPIEFYSCILFILLGFGKKRKALAYRNFYRKQFSKLGFKQMRLKIKFNENHTRNKNIWNNVEELMYSGKLSNKKIEVFNEKDKNIFIEVITDRVRHYRDVKIDDLKFFFVDVDNNPNIEKTDFWLQVLEDIDKNNIEVLIHSCKGLENIDFPIDDELIKILSTEPKNEWALKKQKNIGNKRIKELKELVIQDRERIEKEISKILPIARKIIEKYPKTGTHTTINYGMNLTGNQQGLLRLKLEAYENIEFKGGKYYPNKKFKKKQINELTKQMIDKYIKQTSQRNEQLRQRLTIEFVNGKSISEICKSNPEYSKNEILNHIITDKRLPAELKKMENEQYFDSDTKISLAVPLFAVDYYQWEGEKKDEQKVIDLAVEIKECLTNNPKLRDVFHTRQTYSKISAGKWFKNSYIMSIQEEFIKELISFGMYDQAHNICGKELEISLDVRIIFCKIYCLIKLNKTKDAKIDCKNFIGKLSKRKWDIDHLITDLYIKDKTGEKVNQIFYDIEKESIVK